MSIKWEEVKKGLKRAPAEKKGGRIDKGLNALGRVAERFGKTTGMYKGKAHVTRDGEGFLIVMPKETAEKVQSKIAGVGCQVSSSPSTAFIFPQGKKKFATWTAAVKALRAILR